MSCVSYPTTAKEVRLQDVVSIRLTADNYDQSYICMRLPIRASKQGRFPDDAS